MDPTVTDPAALPPLLAQILAYITLVLALLTAFAHGLGWIVPQLRVLASRTKTTKDDAIVDWIARVYVSLSSVLDAIQIITPRIGLGRASGPIVETRTSTLTPPANGPGGAALVLLACLALPMLHGCATWADSARTTIEVSAVAVDVADHVLADALTSMCAAVAELPTASPERAAALDACLASHHYDDAITAIRVADRALRAAQAAVDAGERIDDKGPWLAIAACLAASVQEVLAAIQAAGVDVPPALTTGASILAGFTGTCADGGAS